ncbi:MAG: hypothetical protein ACREBO_03700 [Novosphingobium sp.]
MPAKAARTSARMLGWALTGSALTVGAALAAQTNMLNFAQAFPATDGPDVGESTIAVAAKAGGRYDTVETGTIDLWFRLSLAKVPGAPDREQVESVEISGEGVTLTPPGVNASTKRYKFSFPYADPHSPSVANQRNSPVKLCNDRLDSLSTAARVAFRRDGARIVVNQAYPIRARGIARWTTTSGGTFKELHHHEKFYDDTVQARVTVVCKPLGATPPRVPPTPPRTPVDPVISAASLRIEPAQVIAVGGQSCPSQLRLYGQVQARRAFTGKAVIFGAGYLSPVTALSFPKGGNRNFTATYPLKWDTVGGLASEAGGLKSQMVSLTMNVTSPNNTVIEQVQETVTVTCKLIAAVVPAGIGKAGAAPVTVDPDQPLVKGGPPAARLFPLPRPVRILTSRPESFFIDRARSVALLPGVDAAIRLADRKGPGGATRLFVRNGGDQAATACEVFAASGNASNWVRVSQIQTSIAPGATLEVAGPLPGDPGLRFAVDCAGEPDNRLDDNLASLP